MTVAELAGGLLRGELSPREAVEATLGRIEQLDPTLNAFVTVRAEEALAEARELEGARARGPLWGVPIAVKDVIEVAGTTTTAASRILAGHVPARDATVVERLRGAGAVIVGMLNTHEFAFGATTTSPHLGRASNPWSPDRICGGSSGGSGAAAAADLAAATLGTDTAGSIRIPACLCGVTGLRPTLGRVPNRGVIPVSWTLDTVGPIARSAEDCALLLRVIAGHAPADPSTADVPVPDYVSSLEGGVGGLRIGVVERLFDRAAPAVAAQVRRAVDELAALGARIEPVDPPGLDDAGVVNQLVMLPEAASAHLPWLRARLDDYGDDVRARLLAGLLLPPLAYATGRRARRAYVAGLRPTLERFDLLAAPQMPAVAPPADDLFVELEGERIPYRQALIPFNSPWSLAGLPVASVPAGFVDGLPVGLALVGRPFGEEAALRAAHAFQRTTDWHEQRPPLAV